MNITEIKNKRIEICLIQTHHNRLSLMDICHLNKIPYFKALNFNLTLKPFHMDDNPDCSIAYLDIQYVGMDYAEMDTSVTIDKFPSIDNEEIRINKIYDALRWLVLNSTNQLK